MTTPTVYITGLVRNDLFTFFPGLPLSVQMISEEWIQVDYYTGITNSTIQLLKDFCNSYEFEDLTISVNRDPRDPRHYY